MRYTYDPPLYFREARVSFIDYTNNERVGTIVEIRTHYDALHVAYHIYLIRVDGNLNKFQIKEHNILNALPTLSGG